MNDSHDYDSQIKAETESSAHLEKSFFQTLVSGDFGLAKTFWLFNFLVGVIATILFRLMTSVEFAILSGFGYVAYQTVVLVGIWRAADKYVGWRGWAILAKIIVILGWLRVMGNVVLLFRAGNA